MTARIGVITFPGTLDDVDAARAVKYADAVAVPLWHADADLRGVDAVVVPGGFSYGDYLRCGAIARFSPVMTAVKKFANDGGLVMGVCNGFQILCESGLLPGALLRNRGLKFVCRDVTLEVQTTNSPFTQNASKGQPLRMPVAHGEGCYFADDATLDQLEAEDRVLFRYKDNPNGSLRDIAGVLNEGRNVLGMMPHPERAVEPLLLSSDGTGSSDGLVILQSVSAACAAIHA